VQVWVRRVYLQHSVSIPRGGTVVDVGANIGLFALLALTEGAGVVVAVEPIPAIADVLELNLARWRSQENDDDDDDGDDDNDDADDNDGDDDAGETHRHRHKHRRRRRQHQKPQASLPARTECAAAAAADTSSRLEAASATRPHDAPRRATESVCDVVPTGDDLCGDHADSFCVRPECTSPTEQSSTSGERAAAISRRTKKTTKRTKVAKRTGQVHHVVRAAVGAAAQKDAMFTYYPDCPGESTRYPSERDAQRERLRQALRSAVLTPSDETGAVDAMREELEQLEAEVAGEGPVAKLIACPVLPLCDVLDMCGLGDKGAVVDLLKVTFFSFCSAWR
jgi:hypothetical protein